MSFDDPYRPSKNVDDRRPGKHPVPPPPSKTRSAGWFGAGVVAVILGWFGWHAAVPPPPVPSNDLGIFATKILGDLEDTWRPILGPKYRDTTLVLYTKSTATKGCGRATSQEGPFECPGDAKVYLDPTFFAVVKTAACKTTTDACEFSWAYIIAHEYGHAVQGMLGIFNQHPVNSADGSIRVELQADCFAGVWIHQSTARWRLINDADRQAALQAARFAGDDPRDPEKSHGTAAQRAKWLGKGIAGGTIESCDTFAGRP